MLSHSLLGSKVVCQRVNNSVVLLQLVSVLMLVAIQFVIVAVVAAVAVTKPANKQTRIVKVCTHAF